jgi:ribosomal protein L37AE/L43A
MGLKIERGASSGAYIWKCPNCGKRIGSFSQQAVEAKATAHIRKHQREYAEKATAEKGKRKEVVK